MTTDIARPPSALARVDVYSHHFSISGYDKNLKIAILEYCKSLSQYGLVRTSRGQFVKQITKVYVGVTRDREIFRIHINLYDEFMQHLSASGIPLKQLWIVKNPIYKPPHVDFIHIDHRDPRPYQKPIIDYILSPGSIKVVTLDPGRGKTFIALSAIRDIGQRVFFSIAAKYIEKWIIDAKEAFDLEIKDIMVIQGSSNLKRFLELSVAGELEAKIIICSATTLYNFIKQYEQYKNQIFDLGYPCYPWELWEKAGIGLRVVDETHEQPHFNFRLDLYTNVPMTLALSGTLETRDPFINRMYDTMFPHDIRYKTHDRDIYISAEALFYSAPHADNRLKYITPGMKSYNHVKFEQSIMKQPAILKEYVSMITDITRERFVDKMEHGQKMVIFCSTVDLCTIVSNQLKKLHPKLVVNRYTSDDEYIDMLNNDITVSTLKSLGTAIDVPGLRIGLMTDSVDSMQANLQCMGRLRRLKDWPDVTPEFLFLVCQDVDKHVKYYENKKELFEGRVVRFLTTYTNYKI